VFDALYFDGFFLLEGVRDGVDAMNLFPKISIYDSRRSNGSKAEYIKILQT
jgi:hypothetical protein